MLQLPFDSPEAKFINKRIFKFIYWNAVSESCELAQVHGPYDSYEGSPASRGILHVDLWGEDNTGFEKLKMDAMTLGLRNSLLVAPMPTASTSQILGNNECFEPFTSNMYVRRTLAGEFIVLNKHLVKDLMDIGMWNKEIKDRIIEDNGSVQNLDIPYTMKAIYRTVWEISQKSIIDMAADRSPYIDQSQSLNLHLEDPTESKISSMHMYAYSKGLKTGMYYLRTRPKAQPIKVTLACTRDCTSCSG
jgi:ribonucleotide reductase alpha subunit